MRRWIWVLVGMSVMPCAWAHPGRTDACRGHAVQERVDYPVSTEGTTPVPSEPGEYHFHFSPQQMNEEVLPSLSEYRRAHPNSTSLGIDHGSFVVAGRTYDIWEYTRQEEAILHCRDDENVVHTGISRIRLPER